MQQGMQVAAQQIGRQRRYAAGPGQVRLQGQREAGVDRERHRHEGEQLERPGHGQAVVVEPRPTADGAHQAPVEAQSMVLVVELLHQAAAEGLPVVDAVMEEMRQAQQRTQFAPAPPTPAQADGRMQHDGVEGGLPEAGDHVGQQRVQPEGQHGSPPVDGPLLTAHRRLKLPPRTGQIDRAASLEEASA